MMADWLMIRQSERQHDTALHIPERIVVTDG
jgi:hypothetical protein